MHLTFLKWESKSNWYSNNFKLLLDWNRINSCLAIKISKLKSSYLAEWHQLHFNFVCYSTILWHISNQTDADDSQLKNYSSNYKIYQWKLNCKSLESRAGQKTNFNLVQQNLFFDCTSTWTTTTIDAMENKTKQNHVACNNSTRENYFCWIKLFLFSLSLHACSHILYVFCCLYFSSPFLRLFLRAFVFFSSEMFSAPKGSSPICSLKLFHPLLYFFVHFKVALISKSLNRRNWLLPLN